MASPEMGGFTPEMSRSELADGISERAKTASEKVRQKVEENFLPKALKLGSMAESWLAGIQNDFYHLAENSDDESGAGEYSGWSPDEIKELYSVLYGEALEDE